jgi:hypothetical protein
MASPLIGDVGGYGTADIVVQDSAGDVRVLRTNSQVPAGGAFWPMKGGTPGREGIQRFLGFDTTPKLTSLTIAAAILLLLGLMNLAVFLTRHARRVKLERASAH